MGCTPSGPLSLSVLPRGFFTLPGPFPGWYFRVGRMLGSVDGILLQRRSLSHRRSGVRSWMPSTCSASAPSVPGAIQSPWLLNQRSSCSYRRGGYGGRRVAVSVSRGVPGPKRVVPFRVSWLSCPPRYFLDSCLLGVFPGFLVPLLPGCCPPLLVWVVRPSTYCPGVFSGAPCTVPFPFSWGAS